MAAGAYHTLAVTADGKLFVWGDSREGQLGVDAVSGTQHAINRREQRGDDEGKGREEKMKQSRTEEEMMNRTE